jgi:hypothetical protein
LIKCNSASNQHPSVLLNTDVLVFTTIVHAVVNDGINHSFCTEMTEVTSSQAGELETSAGLSVVHMPTLNQPIQVQSVIHSNTPSVIQTAGPNVQTIQVVRVCSYAACHMLQYFIVSLN